jgi:hypothetical protein
MGTVTITEWDMGQGQAVTTSDAVALTADFDPQSLELTYSSGGRIGGVDTTTSGTQNKTAAQQTAQTATLGVTLLFDTTTSVDVSVQSRTDPLVQLTMPGKVGGNAPSRRVVRFQWGTFLFFGCVEQMTQTIDFFSDTGVPLRASVHLTLSQVGPPAPASGGGAGSGPASSFGANAGIGASASFGAGASFGASVGAGASFGASAGVGTTPLTLSQDGDTIQGITARAGGAVSWKALAAANNIDNPRLLPPGTVLYLDAGAQARAGEG